MNQRGEGLYGDEGSCIICGVNEACSRVQLMGGKEIVRLVCVGSAMLPAFLCCSPVTTGRQQYTYISMHCTFGNTL